MNIKKVEHSDNNSNNVFQEVGNHEILQAELRSSVKDSQLYYNITSQIRIILQEILLLKNNSNNSNKVVINNKRIKATLLIIQLKKLNRLDKIRIQLGRDALHKEKKILDSTHLLLQNLLYETDYLDKEVIKCLQFKSKDEEIQLISLEDYYKEHSKDHNNPHLLKLSRLTYELNTRKHLALSCSQLQQYNHSISLSLIHIQDIFHNLTPQLNTLLLAAKPLQHSLGLSQEILHSSDNKLRLLPSSLFLLYSRITAYSQAFRKDSIDVKIIGDEDEAVRINENKISEFYDSESDGDDEPKEDDSRGGKSKRHHRSSAKISKQERAEQKMNSALKAHPLCVELIIKSSQMSLCVTFKYLLQLKIIVVKSLTTTSTSTGVCSADVINGHNILGGLFDDDSGEESPHPATGYILRLAGLNTSFSNYIPQSGHPYRWAQRMCGLDFVSGSTAPPCSLLSTSSVESVLIALKKRIRARISLMKELQDLECGNIAPFENMDNVPFSLNSSLTVWQTISWIEYKQAASVNMFINNNLVKHNDLLYRAIITRQSAKLMALVALKHDYPTHAPIFSLTLHFNGTHYADNDDNIRDIERCINTDWAHSLTPITLSTQLTKLICYMDILLESYGSSEFPADKVMFHNVRGRNRIKPYKFLKQCSGIFTQY